MPYRNDDLRDGVFKVYDESNALRSKSCKGLDEAGPGWWLGLQWGRRLHASSKVADLLGFVGGQFHQSSSTVDLLPFCDNHFAAVLILI
jgi:hypothetical protein